MPQYSARAHIFRQRLPALPHRLGRPFQSPGSLLPLLLQAGEVTGADRLLDGGGRHPQIQALLGRPFAGALAARFAPDHIHHGQARLLILLAQDVRRDLHQVAFQLALVPLREQPANGRGGKAAQAAQQAVGFADQLHIGVFNAIVHHFDKMARPVFADVGTAGFPFGYGGSLGQERADLLPGIPGAARQDGGPGGGPLPRRRNMPSPGKPACPWPGILPSAAWCL